MNKLSSIVYNFIFFVIILLFTPSCTKTTSGYLDLDSVKTPKTMDAGQPIQSKVRLLYYTTSYKINFDGFQSTEIATHHFVINAAAKFQSNGQASVNAMEWLMDTTYSIQTSAPGNYILDFYNRRGLFKSDTLVVQ